MTFFVQSHPERRTLCLFIVGSIPHRPRLTERQEQTAPALPDQQTFRQYLRELARGAMRIVLEEVMREELDVVIGVGWGESSPKRKGYRNGYYSRDLATTTGRIEALRVPRDREGQFHTQVAGARPSRRAPSRRWTRRRCLWRE